MFSLSIVNARPEQIKNHYSSLSGKVMHLAFNHSQCRNTEHRNPTPESLLLTCVTILCASLVLGAPSRRRLLVKPAHVSPSRRREPERQGRQGAGQQRDGVAGPPHDHAGAEGAEREAAGPARSPHVRADAKLSAAGGGEEP